MNISVDLNHVDFKIKKKIKKNDLTYKRLDEPVSCLCIRNESMLKV